MSDTIMKMFPAGIVLVGLSTALSEAPASTPPDVEEMRFRVMLDEKQIGHHTFTITREGERAFVRSEAEFDVRVLFIRAYSYRHENTETWEAGCLSRIRSWTDDNGRRFEVSGRRIDAGFELVSPGRTKALGNDCVMSFAYWDRRFLSQPKLLNAQTGDYIPVSVRSLGTRRFETAKGATSAEGYTVTSAEQALTINIWYQKGSGDWLALESFVDGGKVLRYLRVDDATTRADDWLDQG